MENRERGRVLSAVKRCFSRSDLRRSILNKALSKKKGPRGGKMYICNKCKKSFSSSKIQVDHKKPVIPIGMAFVDMLWDDIIENRLYCKESNLQVLCVDCHKEKSKKEAALRAKHRRENAKNASNI